MNASSGIVWCQAVSMIIACGTFGINFLATSIPRIFAGICKGPSGMSFFSSTSTSSVTNADFLKDSPPWRTLCPTAPISLKLFMHPYFGSTSIFKINSIASLCVGLENFASYVSFPVEFCSIVEYSRPILSTIPTQSTSFSSQS